MVNQDYYTRNNQVLNKLVKFDGTKFGYSQKIMPSLNAWFLFGAEASDQLGKTGDPSKAMEYANPAVNPYMRYADTDARGYVVAHFETAKMEAEFVTIAEPVVDYGEAGPPVRRRVRYVVNHNQPGDDLKLPDPEFEGEEPLMGIKYFN